MNQTPNPNPNPNPPTFPTLCGQCGIDEPKFLHNIRQRSNFRRLCTTCVLRLHPQFFCPVCLAVFDRTPPIDAVVCYKCYSCSHSTCVPSSRCPSPCSSCLNPNSLVLNLNRLENGGIGRVIDGNAARLLLAAAKIAAMSMSKAEVAAGMEAERRAKEAAYTKKRAKEALDHVVTLMRREKRNAVVVESGKKVSSVVAVPAVVVDVDGDAGKCKGDASSEVVEALNAVELKDEGRRVESVVNEAEAQGNGAVLMEVDVVGGKDSGGNSTDENGSVKTDDLVKIGENGQEMEKNHAIVDNSVGNSKN